MGALELLRLPGETDTRRVLCFVFNDGSYANYSQTKRDPLARPPSVHWLTHAANLAGTAYPNQVRLGGRTVIGSERNGSATADYIR